MTGVTALGLRVAANAVEVPKASAARVATVRMMEIGSRQDMITRLLVQREKSLTWDNGENRSVEIRESGGLLNKKTEY